MFRVEEFLRSRTRVARIAEGGKGSEVVADCPRCSGKAKLWANSRSGLWICYRCGENGSAVDLVMFVDNLSRSNAFKLVKEGATQDGESLEGMRAERVLQREKISRKAQLPPEFTPIHDRSKNEWNIPLYMKKRGILPTTAAAYRLGFCLSGDYAGRLIFPAHVQGEVVTFQGRSRGGEEPKYRGPAIGGGKKPLYGLDEATGAREVLVVEGPTDVVSAAQKGFPAVGLLGKTITESQEGDFRRGDFQSGIVMLDSNAPKGTPYRLRPKPKEVAERIATVVDRVRIARLPDGYDPDTATMAMIEQAISEAR